MAIGNKIKKGLLVLVFIFLVSILASSVIAPPLITPGQASATVLTQPTAQQASSTTQLSSGVSCLNTRQCTEIDEVWRLIGEFVRGSTDIWDPTIVPAQWRSLSAVRPSVSVGTLTGSCPEGMANIENKYCIDKWEASVVDLNTGQEASPNYYPDSSGAKTQYNRWNVITPSNSAYSQMPPMMAQESDQFVPKAVSKPNVQPQSFANKYVAEIACRNAGKRLCTRSEWYKACVGPEGPTNGYPEYYPYGQNYLTGKCNSRNSVWPPQVVWEGRTGTEIGDPRLGTVPGARQPTGSFPECKSAYDVFDMVGNVDEIVSDVSPSGADKMVFVGSYYARKAGQMSTGCASIITAHDAKVYYDYSIGFRCCADLSGKASAPEVSSKPTTSGNQVREAIAKVAYEEWNKWDQGARKETEPAMQPLVLAYWNAAGYNNIMEWPWSAAFVSYVAKTAGIDFPGRKAHTNYFVAIQKEESTQCKTYRPAEKNSIGKGDIICFCRDDPDRDKGAPCHIDYEAAWGMSHCDVVVEVLGDDRFEIIGGNVNNNVEKRTRDLNDPAFKDKFFGFVSCAGSAAAVQQGLASSLVAAGKTDIRGMPTISAETIDILLVKAGSPAIGTGKYFVKYGQEYNIDPAFALAFFRMESSYGKYGIAAKTKGIGNIVYTPTAIPDYKYESAGRSWSAYNSWENGIRGWFYYLVNSDYYFKSRKYTLEEILPIYAPASENDPQAYINNINSFVAEFRKIES